MTIESRKSICYKRMSGCGNLYITIGEDESGAPYEIFVQNANGCTSMTNTFARYISNDLKEQTRDLPKIIKNLRKVPCAACIKKNSPVDGKSCCHIMADVLERYVKPEKMLDSPF
ncbi:MAG: hypothetical protein M0R51_13975 [Clostridia bacterium]|nr:hypothetical protein [Clostridia bacterium]